MDTIRLALDRAAEERVTITVGADTDPETLRNAGEALLWEARERDIARACTDPERRS